MLAASPQPPPWPPAARSRGRPLRHSVWRHVHRGTIRQGRRRRDLLPCRRSPTRAFRFFPTRLRSRRYCMEHRSACGGDNVSGYGAGMMTQIPPTPFLIRPGQHLTQFLLSLPVASKRQELIRAVARNAGGASGPSDDDDEAASMWSRRRAPRAYSSSRSHFRPADPCA